jgi:mono/diheme cytochrome c family protein
VAASDPAMRAGQQIYADTCSACHQASGKGVRGLFPALAGSPAVQQNSPRNLIRVLLSGADGSATTAAPTAPAMPTFGWKLNDHQIAGVLTFIRNSWGNAARAVDPDDVREQRGDAFHN